MSTARCAITWISAEGEISAEATSSDFGHAETGKPQPFAHPAGPESNWQLNGMAEAMPFHN
jgi:hypothetical protein